MTVVRIDANRKRNSQNGVRVSCTRNQSILSLALNVQKIMDLIWLFICRELVLLQYNWKCLNGLVESHSICQLRVFITFNLPEVCIILWFKNRYADDMLQAASFSSIIKCECLMNWTRDDDEASIDDNQIILIMSSGYSIDVRRTYIKHATYASMCANTCMRVGCRVCCPLHTEWWDLCYYSERLSCEFIVNVHQSSFGMRQYLFFRTMLYCIWWAAGIQFVCKHHYQLEIPRW